MSRPRNKNTAHDGYSFIASVSIWRIHLLDLKTLTEIALSEARSVDDQMEWLDNEQVLYALSENEKGSSVSTDIWVLPVSPEGTPRVLLRGAFSPAVVAAKL